jgi:hypothetical protein
MKRSNLKPIREKKCKVCGDPCVQYNTLKKPVCSKIECIMEYTKGARERAVNKFVKEKKDKDKAELDAMRERSKPHSYWEGKLEEEIRAIVRLIDAKTVCLGCEAVMYGRHQELQGGDNEAHAAHRWAKGSYNNLRYNLMNIFLMGACCNRHNGGSLDEYDEGLNRVYGEGVASHVKEELRALYPTVKLMIPEIKEKIEIARKIKSELKKLDMEYPPKMRIELRREYNLRIGIYTK